MLAIAAIGLLTIILATIMIVSPLAWSRGILAFAAKPYFHIFEITSRLMLGGVLFYFANATLFPLFIKIVAAIFVFAGIFLIVIGSKRHRAFAERSATFINVFRPAGIAGVIFGAFIIYTAVAKLNG